MNTIIIIHNFILIYFILVIHILYTYTIFIHIYLLSNLRYIDFIIINYKAGNIICNINNIICVNSIHFISEDYIFILPYD